ncbi:MAG: hypothetical protein DRI90_06735, partial [Deltaproteobacteria bacterium]
INEIDAGCTCAPGELVDCYDGPTGTDGVGICHGGQKMCEPGGESFTVCFGQVVPLIEECASPLDESCDGSPNGGCPFWGLRFGDETTNDYAWGLAVLGDGTSVLVGEAIGPMDLGGNTLGANGATDVIIGKIDGTGAHLWSARYGDANDSWANDVAVDGAGNMVLVGAFDGTLDFGGLSTPLVAVGTWDGFVAKISAAGVAQWAVPLGDAGTTRPLAIDVDAAGNAAITGYFNGTLTLTGQASSSDDDGFVARLDPSGTITWGTTFGGSGIDHGNDVAFESGNLIVGGVFDETIDFGGQAQTDEGEQDGFVAKLNGSNVQQWIVPIGSTGTQEVHEVAIDGTNVVVLGLGNGTVNIAGQETFADLDDVFVIKLDSGGSLLWKHHFIGPEDQQPGGLAVDGQGSLWFGVSQEATADYGGGVVMSAGSDDWVLVKLELTAGDHLRSLRFGDTDDQDPRALATDSQGNLVVTGDCQHGIDFGFGVLAGSSTYEDICIARLPL